MTKRHTLTIFTEADIFSNLKDPTQPFRPKEATILLVTSGQLKVTCNLEEITCRESSLYFFMRGFVYTIENIDDNFSCIGMTVSGKFILENGAGAAISSSFHIITANRQHPIQINQKERNALSSMLQLLKDFFLPNESLFNYNEILLCLVMSILHTIAAFCRKYNGDQVMKFKRRNVITSRFLHLLQSNTKRERSLQFYAGQLAVTPGYLARVVKQVTGNTAGELIDNAVIIEAKLLLANPSLSIAQIAQHMEFSDQSVFGRFFKHHTGVTPTNYRSLKMHDIDE